VADLPALLTLVVFEGAKNLFNSPVSGEEIDGGADEVSVGLGYGNNHGGGLLPFTRLWVRVKVTC